MKQFDLNEALIKNKVVKLRNGQRATLINFDFGYVAFPIYGELEKGGHERWKLDGTCGYYNNHPLDIIGMWEDEPEFKLPKAVRKLEYGKVYYYICNETTCEEYNEYVYSDISSIVKYPDKEEYYVIKNIESLIENGQLFETEEDAQAWLDFMKNYGKEE